MLSIDANSHVEKCDSVMMTTEEHEDHDEYQYLDLIKKIMKCGKPREDRTGIYS